MAEPLKTKYGDIKYSLKKDGKFILEVPPMVTGETLQIINVEYEEEIKQIKLKLYDTSRDSST